MNFRLPVMLIAPLLALTLAGVSHTARAADAVAAPRAEIEKIVREYILANPEIIKDAIVELQRREKADESAGRDKFLAENAAALLRSPHQAVIGNPNGKVTLVEFFDYNCGYCKKALSDVARLTKENPDLRVVLKDFPVLGPGSVEAAQIEAGVRQQFSGDRFFDYHTRLLSTKGPVGKTQAMALAKEMGADINRLEADARAPNVSQGLAETMGIADKLALNGTPSWVIGNEVIVGAVGFDELREKVVNMQKCGKAICS